MHAAPHALDFVLICATGAPFSPILLILPIEESITYVFSMGAEAAPFQNGDLIWGLLNWRGSSMLSGYGADVLFDLHLIEIELKLPRRLSKNKAEAAQIASIGFES